MCMFILSMAALISAGHTTKPVKNQWHLRGHDSVSQAGSPILNENNQCILQDGGGGHF